MLFGIVQYCTCALPGICVAATGTELYTVYAAAATILQILSRDCALPSAMQTERQFPYTVAITITKAEKLRIAGITPTRCKLIQLMSCCVEDITSSDPYVKISIGGRHIGQTAFKPSTLNPVWNEHFTCPLLHLQSSVLLQVMDHDDYNTDDAMGVAEVELSTMPVNCIIEVKRPLQNVGNIVAKGSIFLTVLVEVRNIGGK